MGVWGVDQVLGVPADISRITIDRPGALEKQFFLALYSPIKSLEEDYMDCQAMDKFVQDPERSGAEKISMEDLRRHCDTCRRCREKYKDILAVKSTKDNRRLHPRNRPHAIPLRETGVDQFPDISKPIEFKDAPISIKRHFNDREEEIKIVEPEVDVPLPEKSRLVVHEGDDCLCDVVFDFNARSTRPYELRFSVMMGAVYEPDHVVAFGTDSEIDRELRNTYRHTIIDRGGVRADMVMTDGKARLMVVYKPLQA